MRCVCRLCCLSVIFIQLTHIAYGYWILLTALFVCQPNFNATKRRLYLRIVGTLIGIIVGLAIIYFIPSLQGQLVMLVLSGVLFFELRSKQYAQATAFITILALINFNLDGSAFAAGFATPDRHHHWLCTGMVWSQLYLARLEVPPPATHHSTFTASPM